MRGALGLFAAVAFVLALGAGCDSSNIAVAEEAPAAADHVAAGAPASVTTEAVPGDLPVFVLRATEAAEKVPDTLIFLHGMCGHGLGYVQSFQRAASSRANVIGLQGDVPCDGGGTWRKWSQDPAELDRRIGRALEATGLARPEQSVAIVGYSQGGTRAMALAARFPERYGRIAVIGAPGEARPRELRRARAVAVMAGEHDAPRWRESQAKALERAGLRATFFELPGASHGAMGLEADRVMGELLDWLGRAK